MAVLADLMARRLNGNGAKVTRLRVRSGLRGLLGLPLLLIKALAEVRRHDVVQLMSSSGKALVARSLPLFGISRLFSKAVILHFVGGAAAEGLAPPGRLQRAAFRYATKVAVPSRTFQNLLEARGLDADYIVIPHVVDLSPFLNKCNPVRRAPVMVAAKALVAYSGLEDLIHVFKAVKARCTESEFWIVGSGADGERLAAIAEESGVPGIRFLGEVDHEQMPSILSSCSVFAHGSRYESFGLVLVEAMASGLPVVAFRIGGIPDVVDSGMNGILVDQGDLKGFSKAVVQVLKNPDFREMMAAAAVEKSKHYSPDVIVPQWLELYEYITRQKH
jgi:glycosyltransferase involved in cell wall biosynthesis